MPNPLEPMFILVIISCPFPTTDPLTVIKDIPAYQPRHMPMKNTDATAMKNSIF
ncbi:MAG: hypothetical protein ACLUOD_15530 [[Clostridium] innocuum]